MLRVLRSLAPIAALSAVALCCSAGCQVDGSDPGTATGGSTTSASGGSLAQGGSTPASSGGALTTGGAIASGGAIATTGGAATSTGGTAGTATTTGGATEGGTSPMTGGAPNGGGSTSQGGAQSGGASGAGGSGGAAGNGGKQGTGGTIGGGGSSSGGSNTGGKNTGGSSTGGAPSTNPTVWLAGDSTVKTYAAGNTDGNNGVSIEGWGQEIGQFFKTQVTINNQAIGGRSVAFFMWSVVKNSAGEYQCVDDQGNPQYQLDASGNHVDTSQWAAIKNGIKAGDFLLIQFGTNDETHTCPRYVSLPDFATDLGIMADFARSKGATPIFVTPMGHRTFSGTMATNTLLPYADAMKQEATKKTVEVEDLNLRSIEYYTSVGNTFLATNIFDGGTTHFIKAGAVKMAELVVGEIRKNNGPLAAFLK